MKLASVRYLAGEGFKNTWVNRLMTFASVGVLMACMILIGLALVFSENISLALGRLEQQNVVMVYMKDYNWALYEKKDAENSSAESSETAENASSAAAEGETGEGEQQTEAETPDQNGIVSTDYVIHNEDEANALCDEISKLPNVASVEYVSSEEGLKEITDSMLDGKQDYFTFLNEDYGNPLSAAARVTMNDMSEFSETVEKIKDISGVGRIRSYDNLAEKITSLKKGITVAGFWIIAILLIISLMIVSNTIRVTMYSRKLQISIMKAVGATDAFIRVPFMVEGMVIGIASALLSEGLLYFIYRVGTESIASMLGTTTVIPFGKMALPLLGIFALIGIGAGMLGSIIMISKYLRKEGSEFAAI